MAIYTCLAATFAVLLMVPIWAAHDVGCSHSGVEGTEDLGKGGVVKFLHKNAVLIRSLLMTNWRYV